MTMHPPLSTRRNGDTRVIPSAHFLALSAAALAMLAGLSVASAATITVDASKQTAGNPHFWSAAFGTGKAMLALRADWQTHYKLGNRELGAQRVRGHGLFNSGEMDLWKSTGQYDWKNLDTYLLAITSANMRPIIELDFMPKGLSSTANQTSPPKDYNEWKAFIKAFTQHLVDKYGMDDVSQWYFEVWNEPDYPGFWDNSDMNAYYTLYDNTVDALTSVIPNVLVGGPATTNASPIGAFLKHCKSANKRVTFASSHCYPGGSSTGTSADAAGLVNDNDSRVSAITGAGYSTADVKSFNTEWNSSYSGQGVGSGDTVVSMDNHWNVGFILKGAKLLSDQNKDNTPPVDVLSYWVLSDVFDEDGGTDGIHMTQTPNTPFGTIFGVITFQGMRKAAFNAFKLLNYLGPKRLQSSGGTGKDGIDAMATASESGDSLQILAYNYYATLNTASGSGDSVTINVSNLPTALANQKVFVTQFLVDETHSNPYSVWQSQNKPGTPSEDQWRAMRAAQHLALYPDTKVGDQQTLTTSFTSTFTLKKQAGTLIIVSAKRPLTGRDALVEIEGEDFDGQDKATKEDSGDSSTLGQSISVTSGGYVYFENVDYTDAGVSSVQLRVKTAADTSIELHADTQDGKLLAKCAVTSTSNAWATQTCTLSSPATGVSKLYLVFGGAAHLNWLKFSGGGSNPGTGGAGGSAAGGTSGGSNGGATGSGSGGATGRGGAAGNGTGGAAGNAGGGAAGNAGGGAAGNAGGGAAGNAGGGAAGDGKGGAAGSGGSASSSGGSGGTTTSNGNGGASGGSGGSSNGGQGGASGSGGASSGSGTSPGGSSKSGCTCRVGDAHASSGAIFLMGLVAAVLGLGRRKLRRQK